MEEGDFEGTLVLEKLAEIGAVDAFYEAVDADDFRKAATLLRKAGVEEGAVTSVLKLMAGAERGADEDE